MNYGPSLGWRIEFDEGFADDLKKVGHADLVRIKKFLDKLQIECSDPRQRGEPYSANLAGFWKYRIGSYRLICKIENKEVVILCAIMAAHRSKSYSDKSLEDLFKRALEIEKKL